MPYTLKTQQIAVKDPDTGVYSGVDILAEQTTEGLLTEITATGEAVKADVSAQMATERSDFNTYVTNKNQEIATMIADADKDVSDLEDRKQDVATAVSGMLSKGVDNSLTTANVPAESKATGDLFETIVEGKATQPNDKWNRLWIKPSANDYEIPTMDDHNELKSALSENDMLFRNSIAIELIEKGYADVYLYKGYYYDTSSGKFRKDTIDPPRWMATPMIPVSPGMKYKFINSSTGTDVNGFAREFKFDGTNSRPTYTNGWITPDKGSKYITRTIEYNTSLDYIRIVAQDSLSGSVDSLAAACGDLKSALSENDMLFRNSIAIELIEKGYADVYLYKGYYYDTSSGKFRKDTIDPPRWMATPMIPVSPGMKYKFINSSTGTDVNGFAREFKFDGTNSSPTYTNGWITPDKGSKYITQTIKYNTSLDYIRIVAQDSLSGSVDSLSGSVDSLSGSVDSLSEAIRSQILDQRYIEEEEKETEIVYGKFIKATDGAVIDHNLRTWSVTAPIAVNAGEVYLIDSWMWYDNGMMVAYNDNGDIVDFIIASDVSKVEPHENNMFHLNQYFYTVPNGVTSMILGIYIGKGYTYSVKKVRKYFGTSIEEVERIVGRSEPSNNEIVSIATSDKIGFFGNSYMNGYTIRTHHVFDNLSMWSDYLFYNYGKSGDDVLETLMRINSNQTFLGTVPVQDWGITYGVLAMHTNDGALFAANPETFYQNCKKVCEAIKAMGGVPILGTEHQQSQMYYGAQHLAEEEGYQFWDWAKTAAAMKWFKPFMTNMHPATRTHWSWTYGMKNYIDCLPRPMKSLKLFRKRPDTESTLEALKFNSLIERSQRFVEIYNGSSCLTKATEKYFDRLNNGIATHENVNSEYQKLQSRSGSVSFGTHALIECVTPYTKNSINTLKMMLSASGVTSAYIRRVLSLENPLPATRYVAFSVTAGENLLPSGTQFTVTGGVFNDNILGTYTVSQVVNGVVVTTTSSSGKTTSGTDNPTTNLSGVTLKGSYDYPSADYMLRYTKPLCEWDEITINASGETDLTDYLNTHMDYDKVSILLIGSDISISNVYFSVSGSQKKRTETSKKPKMKKNGTSLLTDNLLDDGTAWNNINSVPKYTPVISAVDNETVDPLPTGVTTVRELSEGDSIWQNLLTTHLGTDPYHVDKIQIRIIARYFPLYVNSDSAWENSEIYEGSYDCAEMSVSIEGSVRCETVQVGTSWNEFIFDVDYFNVASPKRLTIVCNKKSLQIAKAEAVVVT